MLATTFGGGVSRTWPGHEVTDLWHQVEHSIEIERKQAVFESACKDGAGADERLQIDELDLLQRLKLT